MKLSVIHALNSRGCCFNANLELHFLNVKKSTNSFLLTACGSAKKLLSVFTEDRINAINHNVNFYQLIRLVHCIGHYGNEILGIL